MLERLSRNRRNAALVVIALLAIYFSWTVRAVLNPLILGYLLAYTLNPMVQNLERRGWARRAAANLIFLTVLVFGSVIGVVTFHQGKSLVGHLSTTDLAESVRTNLPDWVGGLFEGEAPEAPLGDALSVRVEDAHLDNVLV